MSRHLSTETFQMDLRSSSQQNLDASRSSSLESQRDLDLDQTGHSHHPSARSYKIDRYSLPVFLWELLLLGAVAALAYVLHFKPYLLLKTYTLGFYCDDIAYRKHLYDTPLNLQDPQNELTLMALLVVVGLVLIIFCELVNSLFGSTRFRNVRAFCKCCKLHSITRRSIRFCGAFLLGFVLVTISSDVLAAYSGQLRPYFAEKCPNAYQTCAASTLGGGGGQPSIQPYPSTHSQPRSIDSGGSAPALIPVTIGNQSESSRILSPSAPTISSQPKLAEPRLSRPTRQAGFAGGEQGSPVRQAIYVMERQWVPLDNVNIKLLCNDPWNTNQLSANELALWDDTRNFKLNASWPSTPAALVSYTCLFLSCYLCFVGTARPFRMLTCCLVLLLLILAATFNAQLVKINLHHWADIISGSILALVTVVFISYVYLNKFQDAHYYQELKLLAKKNVADDKLARSQTIATGESSFAHYDLHKANGNASNIAPTQLPETSNNISNNNDLAMRYFQIPRANYRGAPRPLSSLNQMR